MTAVGLNVLLEEECVRLLRRQRLGRVAMTVEQLPAVFPVNYALLDDEVVFRTAPGTKLLGAILERVVAFEVDWVAPNGDSGWSVLVIGHASRIVYEPLLERAQTLGLRPWAPGERDYYVKITPEHVSGRSFGPDALSGRDPG
jgi:hypothetical protein